ncbi:MAG TPA: type II toxin-antitoxin system VapC family toxin [Tepidisphaeraceae bacterium]|nr:type II toxin-antitoxin system VapC family toxin [Tepidisphaeraceae bacterium]
MADYFIDSSALVKRYIAEAGSAWIRSITESGEGNTIFVSAIAEVEVVAAPTRRLRPQSAPTAAATSAAFRADMRGSYQIVDPRQSVIARAVLLAEQHALRGYDALQLASAVELYAAFVAGGLAPVTLISSDVELNAAARLEGLNVIDPSTQNA